MADNKQKVTVTADVSERYVAAMVLSAAGDALGYKNGEWEFCGDAMKIHKELEELGGVKNIKVKPKEWIVSDDTVMHMATARALLTVYRDKGNIIQALAGEYKNCMSDMENRAAGLTCQASCFKLDPSSPEGCHIPFNPKGGGCDPESLDQLIEVSIISGRLSHHHPTGYLGALASALFTSYAIQGLPPKCWGSELMKAIEKGKDFIEKDGHSVKENLGAWGYFKEQWDKYLALRNIVDGDSEPQFPSVFGVKERDEFYSSISFNGCGGSSGHDAPMIAYDAILGCNADWKELCDRAMFHGGDSDSSGVIAGCLYGAMYGFAGVPKKNYRDLEYYKEIDNLGKSLFKMRSGEPVVIESTKWFQRYCSIL
ncbi:ADPRH-like protein [Mya arenaria]|uniref:ADP-ribosylhydrolase ARH1 n=1 Tax=Mya arenaria TaxID=6604 RepID=A0ABY7DED7_MYAAR|nr:ADPRH-like protein [Mya arenaria]